MGDLAEFMQRMNEKTERNNMLLALLYGPEKAAELARERRREFEKRQQFDRMVSAIETRPTPIIQPSLPWFWIVIVITLCFVMVGIYIAR